MWYLAEILLAEPPQPDLAEYQCESCNVVFQAASAAEAFQKAVAWGQAYAAEPPAVLQLLGVSHLTTVGVELGDGIEICGRYFQAPSVWERTSELIPPPDQLKAIRWERSQDTPIGELFTTQQIDQIQRTWGQGPERGDDAGQTQA